MVENIVYPNPTVKRVVFQIRFPNLFSIETKIGDFQVKIMETFPESSLIYERPIVFTTNIGDSYKSELKDKADIEIINKIWRFSSPNNYILNIHSDSLDITSEYHKTYDNKESKNRFRDIIELVLKNFFEVYKIPIISRVGIRYIDECPIPEKRTNIFNDYFNTAFNLNKFNLEEAVEMDFKSVVKRDKYFMRYIESLQTKGDKYFLILDFDGFTTNVKSENCLSTTDDLHTVIKSAFFSTIKEPVIEYMSKSS